MLAENRPQRSGYLLNHPKTENLKKPKAPLLAGLLHDILILKQYLRLLGGDGDRQHTVSPRYQAISFKYIYQLLTKTYCTN
jgi:hypothetical protein